MIFIIHRKLSAYKKLTIQILYIYILIIVFFGIVTQYIQTLFIIY
jgi:hypothetical protein